MARNKKINHRHRYVQKERGQVPGSPAYVERCGCGTMRIRPWYGRGEIVVRPGWTRDGIVLRRNQPLGKLYREAVWLASSEDRVFSRRMNQWVAVVIPPYLFEP